MKLIQRSESKTVVMPLKLIQSEKSGTVLMELKLVQTHFKRNQQCFDSVETDTMNRIRNKFKMKLDLCNKEESRTALLSDLGKNSNL